MNYTEDGQEKKTVYLEPDIEDSVRRAELLLAGVESGARDAIWAALRRAGEHSLTVGMKIVSEEYAIGQNELKRRTRTIRRVKKGASGGYEVTFGYSGHVIPLLRFDTQIGSDGRIYARVLRSNVRELISNAFAARVKGQHTGVFVRKGDRRYPIHELFGPSAVAAFYEHEETVDKMEAEVQSSFEKRIDHEITRILNGWGGR